MSLRAVDFAQAALVAGFVAVMWEEMVTRSGTVFHDDTAYRFGFVFVAVLVFKLMRRRSEPAQPARTAETAEPAARPEPARPADSAKDPSP